MRLRLPAELILKWRWPLVVAWSLFAALMVPLAYQVHERLHVSGQPLPRSESTRAKSILRERFSTPYARFAVLVIQHPSLTVRSRQYKAFVDSVTVALQREPYVLQTLNWWSTGEPSFRSRDGRITFVLAGLRQSQGTDPPYVPFMRATVARAAGTLAAEEFRTYVTGEPAFDYDLRTVASEDSGSLERRIIPITFLLLVVAFGALIAALIPVVVGFAVITITLGVIAALAVHLPISIFVLNLATMIGLGVGIDYSLLVVTRFREELETAPTPRLAAERTIATAGAAVFSSGAIALVGFGALMTVPLQETRSVGLGGLVVVTTAVALAVTFLPCLLAILGHRIDWPILLAQRLSAFRFEVGWYRYARVICNHPIRAVVAAGLAVALLTAPAAWLKIGLPATGWLPEDTESGRGLRTLQQMGQGGALQPLRVVLDLPDGNRVLDPDRLRGLKALSDSIRENPRVQQVRGLVDIRSGIPLWQYAVMYGDTARARERYGDVLQAYLSRDGSATVYDVLLRDSVSLDGSLAAVREVRRLAVRALPNLGQAELLVGGTAASNLDFQDDLLRRFPYLVALVLGVTGLMLAWLFRSLLVPIKAVIMNTLSVTASFGLTVLVFQWGIGGSLFGVPEPTRAIFAIGPVLVFAVVFGLSMDYEVFLLARIKEAFDVSHDNDEATVAGLSATGATITSAALIMLVVFGAFAFARVMAVQMIGFGLAVAVLLDATLIRIVMVPAVMHLAGRFNWWPGYRRRIAPGAVGGYRRGSGESAAKAGARSVEG